MKRPVIARGLAGTPAQAFANGTYFGPNFQARSIRVPDQTAFPKITTNLPSPHNYTACGWSKINSFGVAPGLCIFEDNADTHFNDLYFVSGALNVYSAVNNLAFSSSPTAGLWFFWAITGDAAPTLRGYWCYPTDAVFLTQSVSGNSSTAVDYMSWGNDISNEAGDSEHSNIKIWDAVLSSAELRREMFSQFPIRRANLNRYLPLRWQGDVKDRSGVSGFRDAGNFANVLTGSVPPVAQVYMRSRYAFDAAAAGGLQLMGAMLS